MSSHARRGGSGTGRSRASTAAADPPPTDTALSEVAIGVAAGAAGVDDISANVDCETGGTWQGASPSLTYQPQPTNCTITYGNGTTTALIWTGGPWNLDFVGCAVPPVNSGLVGSGCIQGNSVTWSTVTPIVRTWIGPLGHILTVTNDSGSGSTGASGWSSKLNAAGTLITCTSACPIPDNDAGTRTINIGSSIGATQITGTLDGNPFWNHTVYTQTALTINGSGSKRVIESGTVVVEHNLAQPQITTTTTFNGPLKHMAGCAFPVSGSVTTTITDGIGVGLSETVAFSGTCGQATVTHPDGSQQTLYLSLVL